MHVDDPRFVETFRMAWGRSVGLAHEIVGADQAERLTVEGFGRLLERWHRIAQRPDAEGRALFLTASACVAHVRREGRSGTRPPANLLVDPALRAGIAGMPVHVGVAFVLRHLAGCDDERLARVTRTSRRRAASRADRGLAILRRQAGPGGHGLLDA